MPCPLTWLKLKDCGRADEYFRTGDEEEPDDYGSSQFCNVLWRVLDFRPSDYYTPEQVTEMGPGPDYTTGEIPIKHLYPAQIAWVHTMVSPFSLLRQLPCHEVMKTHVCFKKGCGWQAHISM